MLYFSYCPECGFERFSSPRAAQDQAEECLAHFRDEAGDDGWLGEEQGVCCGKLTHVAEATPARTGCEYWECDDECGGHKFDLYHDVVLAPVPMEDKND